MPCHQVGIKRSKQGDGEKMSNDPSKKSFKECESCKKIFDSDKMQEGKSGDLFCCDECFEMHECCNCGEKDHEPYMSKDHDGHWFCKECDEKN
jgi:hypothetical protein